MNQFDPQVLAAAAALVQAQQGNGHAPAKGKKAKKQKADKPKQDPALTGLYWFIAIILLAWICSSLAEIFTNLTVA